MSEKPTELKSEGPKIEQWGSQLGVILAVAGSAVGLGNFLRFPGLAASEGGGAFMIPYFIALLLVGIPLCWAEWIMGRYSGRRGFNSVPGIFMVVCKNPAARYAAVPGLVIPLVIYMYYLIIEAWCLYYAFQYLTGSIMSVQDTSAYFKTVTGQSEDFTLFDGGHKTMLVCIVFCFCVNFFLIYRGISKGIETFCKFAMPIMAICAVCVLVRVLTLPPQKYGGVMDGLGFMWNPDFGKLATVSPWVKATGQIFFSLSVGFGIIINYASYLKKKDDVALSGLTSCSVNEFFEVCLGGLITISAGFMFFGATVSSNKTFDMGFKVLPQVFTQMQGGQIFGFLWFILLFLAAVTSSVSMLQPVISFFEEGFGLKRHASVGILGLICSFGSLLVCVYSKGMQALGTLDYWTGTVLICTLAMIQSIVYAWILGPEKASIEASHGSKITIPWFMQNIVMKYISPVYLIFLMFFLFTDPKDGIVPQINALFLPQNRVAMISFTFLLLIICFITLLVHIAGIRWIKQGKFKNTLRDGSLKEID